MMDDEDATAAQGLVCEGELDLSELRRYRVL
jgi:hypothetical protein